MTGTGVALSGQPKVSGGPRRRFWLGAFTVVLAVTALVVMAAAFVPSVSAAGGCGGG